MVLFHFIFLDPFSHGASCAVKHKSFTHTKRRLFSLDHENKSNVTFSSPGMASQYDGRRLSLKRTLKALQVIILYGLFHEHTAEARFFTSFTKNNSFQSRQHENVAQSKDQLV